MRKLKIMIVIAVALSGTIIGNALITHVREKAYAKSILNGVVIGKLSMDDLTAAERKNIPSLLDGEEYIAVQISDTIYHAVRLAHMQCQPGDVIGITNYANADEYYTEKPTADVARIASTGTCPPGYSYDIRKKDCVRR